jgi:transcriptional regulator with XRE-family HTH domain
MADLAEILIEGRQRKHWSQQELAFRAGVSISTVTRAEQGKGIRNVNSLRHLAVAIGYDADALVRLAKEPDSSHRPAWLPEQNTPPLLAIPGLTTADRLGGGINGAHPEFQPPPRMRPVPHYGRVSAVRTDTRDEVPGDFSNAPDVGVDFTVSVDGQCMEPRYEDGVRVGCSIRRFEKEGFVWGKDYWIRFKDGQTTLKCVKPDPRDADKFICAPLNAKAKAFSRCKADVDSAARVLVVLLG